jgi:hypothetical protein
MYILQLNDMRASQIEIMTSVARGETYEELEAMMDMEKVEPYSDGRWQKSYRKDGPLEWYNLPYGFENNTIVDVGDADKWADDARKQFEMQVMNLPEVGD